MTDSASSPNDEPRPVRPEQERDLNWRTREQTRLTDGTYAPLRKTFLDAIASMEESYGKGSFECEPFPHRSKNNPELLAYTPSATHGELDRALVVKPGRYLERHYQNVPARVRSTTAALFRDPPAVQFATTAEEISHVYTNGPSSCMSGERNLPNSKLHVASCYAAGDYAVAYIERDGRITARMLCIPEEKVGIRSYGDCAAIEEALEAHGYTLGLPKTRPRINLAKQKMTALRERWFVHYVGPYIDNYKSIINDVGPDGEIVARVDYQSSNSNRTISHSSLNAICHDGRVYHTSNVSICRSAVSADEDKVPRVTGANDFYNALGSYSSQAARGLFDHIVFVLDNELSKSVWTSAASGLRYLNSVPKNESFKLGPVAVGEEHLVVQCALSGETLIRSNAIELEGEHYARRFCFECSGSNKWALISERVVLGSGHHVSTLFAADHTERCQIDGNRYLRSSMVMLANGKWGNRSLFGLFGWTHPVTKKRYLKPLPGFTSECVATPVTTPVTPSTTTLEVRA